MHNKKKIPELRIEQVNGRTNFIFLSLLEYRREDYLVIVDMITPTEIGAYVLDFAEQEHLPIQDFLSTATHWFYGKSDLYPLSVELASKGLTERCAPIYRSFDTTYVTRIIGHAFVFDKMNKTRVRRRRVVQLPEGIAIKFRPLPK